MRKMLFFLVFLIALCSLPGVGTAASSGNITASKLKEEGVILKNNTMVPAAAVTKALDINFEMNNKTGQVSIWKGTMKVVAKKNSKYVKINGVATSYTAPVQLVEGKLMIPVQLLKDAFKIKVSADYDLLHDYLKNVTLQSETHKVTVPVNDLYESHHKYIGKTAWIFKHNMLINNAQGSIANGVGNLAQVKITKIKRDGVLGNWLNVYFTHNGRTYYAELDAYDFESGFMTTSPYKQFNFPEKYWKKIRESVISTGMTTEMVYLSWGLYDRHYEDIYSWGTTDMWVYESSYGSDHYLYFYNGILENISSY